MIPFHHLIHKLLKTQKRNHYDNSIEKNKSGMKKKTSYVLKTVINKKRRAAKYTEFRIDGCRSDDLDKIANISRKCL